MMAKQVKSASMNNIASSSVMLPLYVVKGTDGLKYGTMVDGCSTDNYIKNKIARKNNLEIVEQVQLEIEGMGQVKTSLKDVKVYKVPIYDKLGMRHELHCYGVDQIASLSGGPNKRQYHDLCRKFGYDADRFNL